MNEELAQLKSKVQYFLEDHTDGEEFVVREVWKFIDSALELQKKHDVEIAKNYDVEEVGDDGTPVVLNSIGEDIATAIEAQPHE